MSSIVTNIPAVQSDRGPVVTTVSLFILMPVILAGLVSVRQAVLFLIGGVIGMALYHGAFGFTGGWRRLVVEGRGRGVRAQMLMIGLAAAAIIPIISAFAGHGIVGAIAPVGVSVVVGSALFGFGMQIGGACGSGTLFTVGGGSARMLITMTFFCIGALWGAADLPFWLSMPTLGPVDLGQWLGVLPAVLLTLAVLALIAAVTLAIEKRRYGTVEGLRPTGQMRLDRLVHGPWSLVTAAVVLAAANIATVLVAGHPWSITYGYGLWAAKVAEALGFGVDHWRFFASGPNALALARPVLFDVTSVMNFGVILGAALAAGLAGRFAPKVPIRPGSALAAVLGGLLMGYGARLSFGCNIGALFSGIASGSLHGWLWFLCAFLGSAAGVRARRVFGMS